MSVAVPPISTIPVHAAAVPDVPIHRLTVEQYEAMIAAGILTEDDPVELLEGWLVEKRPKSLPHISPPDYSSTFFPICCQPAGS